jgi:hypothetical protein
MSNLPSSHELDEPAQITIALTEFVQTALAVATRPYWRVLPNPLPLKRNDVVNMLAAQPKPVRVAPLAQPGALGTWAYQPTSELEKTLFEQRARNVEARVSEILAPFTDGGESIPVLLEHEATEWIFPSSSVEQWSTDYVLDGVGWILVDSGGDPRAPVRFILGRPDGTWFPSEPRRPLDARVQKLLGVAEHEAGRYNHDVAGTEHVLLAMSRHANGPIRATFDALGLDYDTLEDAVSKSARMGPAGMRPRSGARSSRLRNALELAARISSAEDDSEVGEAHLLLAMLRDAGPSTMVAGLLKECGHSTDDVIEGLAGARETNGDGPHD